MTFSRLTEGSMTMFGEFRNSARANERRPPEPEAVEAPRVAGASRDPIGAFGPTVTVDLAALAEKRDLSRQSGCAIPEFLAAFANLLGSVASGDVISARDAADILQLELFAAPPTDADGETASADMLTDLIAMIRFARQGDLPSAEAAASLLAQHMQSALSSPVNSTSAGRLVRRNRAARQDRRRESQGLVQGATAAYEQLMDPDASAA